MAVFSMTKVENEKDGPQKTVWDHLYHWRYVLSAIGFVVIVVAGGWFLVYPRWQLLRSIEQSIVTQTETNKLLENLVARLTTMEKNYLEAQQDPKVSLLSAFLPSTIDVARILVDMNAVAQMAQVPLLAVDVTLPEATAGRVTAPKKGDVALPKGVLLYAFSVKFSGPFDYETYKKYLSALEKAMPLYEVQSGSIQAPKAGETGGAGSALELKLQSYYLPAEKGKK